MLINFECKSCHKEFDGEVGKITFTPNPDFQTLPICPRCGPLDKNGVYLSELGQSQMTDAFMSEE
jgi:NAD-dependent SIR2 family protein deacetylase